MYAKFTPPISKDSQLCSIYYWGGEDEDGNELSFGARFDLGKMVFIDPFPEEFKRQATLFILNSMNVDQDYIEKWKKQNVDPSVKDRKDVGNKTGFMIRRS